MADNLPGKSTWDMARNRRIKRVLIVIPAIILLLWIGLNGIRTNTPIALVSCLLAMYGLDKIVDPLLDKLIAREKQAVRGAKAEETVAEILKSLSSEHVVLHDIRADWGNIDHLIFRKDGAIFLLETKSHGGQVTEVRGELYVNGKPENFISQSHKNIYWLREFLKTRFQIEPWISTAVVFTNAYVSVRRPLRGVSVINAKYLNRWMSREPSQSSVSVKLWSEVEQIKSQLQLRS